MSVDRESLEKASPETWKELLAREADTQQVRAVALAVVACVIVMVSGLTYCSSQPTTADPAAMEQLRAKTLNATANGPRCTAAGGSWMPVVVQRGSTAYEMACVTKDTLDLVKSREPR